MEKQGKTDREAAYRTDTITALDIPSTTSSTQIVPPRSPPRSQNIQLNVNENYHPSDNPLSTAIRELPIKELLSPTRLKQMATDLKQEEEIDNKEEHE